MRQLWNAAKMAMAGMMAAVVLVACGGSSGSSTPAATTVSGVAAAGAPLIGKAWLKDSLGVVKGPIDIASDGSFSFDAAGLTAPFLIQADGTAGGQGFLLHSVATGTGTANVNPITNMVVAAAAGGKDPATVFGSTASGSAPDVANINQTSVDAAITAIKKMLAPLLTAFSASDIDPLKGVYVADPTKNNLDAVFEAVKITVIPSSTAASTFTVENKLTGDTIASGATTTTAISSTTTTAAAIPSADVATDIDQIGTMLVNWTTALNKGVTLSAADLETFYAGSAASPAAYGYQNGSTRKDIIDGMATKFSQSFAALGGIKELSNFSLKNDVTTSYPGMYKVYQVFGTVRFASGNSGVPDGGLYVARESAGAAWKFIGNGRKIDADIRPYAHKYRFSDGTKSAESGLYIFLDDIANQGYLSARVTGPGLPVDGVTFSTAATNSHSATRLAIDSGQVTSQQLADQWGKYPLSDTAITSLATKLASGQKAEYLVEVYLTASAGASGAAVHSFTVEITAPPITLASLATGDYFPGMDIPSLTSQTLSSLALLFDTTISFTVTLPTAITPSWAKVHADIMNWNSQIGSTGEAQWDKIVPLNALSGTFLVAKPTTFTATYAYLSCEVNDLANRDFAVYAQFQ